MLASAQALSRAACKRNISHHQACTQLEEIEAPASALDEASICSLLSRRLPHSDVAHGLAPERKACKLHRSYSVQTASFEPKKECQTQSP